MEKMNEFTRLRMQAGFATKAELSRKTGIAARIIGEYENRRVFPRDQNLQRVAKALKVKPATVLAALTA